MENTIWDNMELEVSNDESDGYPEEDVLEELDTTEDEDEFDSLPDEAEEEDDTSDLDSGDDTYEDDIEDLADDDGAIIDDEELMQGADTYVVQEGSGSFIKNNGDIVVMSNQNDEDSFEFQYIDITAIGVTQRIRQQKNVDSLVKSIKSTGLLEPVVVAPLATDGLYVLLAGYRRLLACAKCGLTKVPSIINNRVSTTEIPILEAIMNHSSKYTNREIIDYIEILEKQRGIMNATMIEYLMQLEPGDYSKLKDVLSDNDDDIVSRMLSDEYSIQEAFKKLEARRKKETSSDKELRKATNVFDNAEISGASRIEGTGEEGSEEYALSDDEIKSLAINANDIDEGLEEASLDSMVEAGRNLDGYGHHKQNVDERERMDPSIRRAILAEANNTCVCCKRKFLSDVLDAHHLVPVFLGGVDSVENGAAACLTCHRSIHLYSFGQLQIPKERTQEELEAMTIEDRVLYYDEQMRYKRIVKLGNIIREGIVRSKMSKEQVKKQFPIGGIGRNMPGREQIKA